MLRPAAIYCRTCGTALETRVPADDDRPRQVCPSCGHIDYDNPTVVVGCLVERHGAVLLCRRAIEPAHGRWTLPAGYLEIGEGLAAGARRETMEEAGVDAEIHAPHAQLDLPHIGQTYAIFRATAADDRVAPGCESLEARYVAPADIPWRELAFPAIHFALQLWAEDRQAGGSHVHCGVLRWRGTGSRWDAASYRLDEWLRIPVR